MKLTKYCLFQLLLLMVCSLSVDATVRPETVDSLLEVYQDSHNNKEVLARQIVDICLEGDMLTEEPLLQSLEASPTMAADSIDLMVYYAAVRYYYNSAYFKEGLGYVERALPLSKDNDTRLHATLLCDRCYCLFKQGRMTEAIEAGQEAMQYCLTMGPSVYLARAYLYLSICNYSLPNTEQAKLFIQKAIEVDEQIGSNNNTHNILGIACEIYSFAQETDKAIEYGQRAVEEARAIGYDEGVVNHLSQLSYAYNRQGDYQRGLEAAQQAVDFVEAMDVPDRNLLAISLEYVAYNLLDMKHNAEAVPILLRAIKLEQEVGNTRSVCYDYKALAEAYEPDEPRQAVAALRKYIVMADSIHSAQMSEALGQANAQFRNNELQDENSVLQDENSARRRQNLLILIASTAVALLLLAVIAFVVYAYRLRGKTNRSLRQQQLAQEAFFTNVTHEFRTPLTVILGVSRQLRQGDPQKPEGLKRPQAGVQPLQKSDINISPDAGLEVGLSLIEHEGNRLLQLVNQLLDVARMKSGMADPQWQRGNIVPLFTMFTESLQQLADSRQVTLTYKHITEDGQSATTDDQSPETVQEADFVGDYMQKIVVNLLSNALKNTGAGGNVTLSSRCTGNRFIFAVSDTGCGIDPADLPHIFEPFYMGRNSQTANSTGIGLTLTKQLVEAMNGTISVESTPEEGTTFTVTLPRKQKSSLTSGPSSPTPSPSRGGEGSIYSQGQETIDSQGQETIDSRGLETIDDTIAAELSTPLPSAGGAGGGAVGVAVASDSVRILIVEDNREVAFYTGTLLAPHYDVYYATDGEQGLEKARQLVPDIIVTDVMMPRMDGLELCRHIRHDELTCHIPVVVVTAKVTEKNRLEGLQAGATAYLNKPFNAEELLTVVGNLLQQQRDIQQRFMKSIGKGALLPNSAPQGGDECEKVNEEVRSESVKSEMNDFDRHFLERLKKTVTEEMEHGNVEVERIASLMAMSHTQLRRKISAVTGISAARYITLLRIEEAKELLKQYPKVTITEVAYRTGFADNAHFTKVFHRFTDMTPMQFVKENTVNRNFCC